MAILLANQSMKILIKKGHYIQTAYKMVTYITSFLYEKKELLFDQKKDSASVEALPDIINS